MPFRAASVSGACHPVSGIEACLASAFSEFLGRQLVRFDWAWCPLTWSVPPSLKALPTTDREDAEFPGCPLGRGVKRHGRGGCRRWGHTPAAASATDMFAAQTTTLTLPAEFARHHVLIGSIGVAR